MSRHAMIQVSHFMQINLLTASPAVLLDWTVKEWQSTLLQLHSDRQGWKGLPPISRRDTIQVIAQFQPHQQKQILNEIAGAFQTHCQQSVWNSEVTEECNLCGQIDTRYHRVFTCAATQQVRDEFAGTMTALLDIGTEWHELPVIFEHEADDMHRTIHATWPEPDIPFQMFQQLQLIDHQPHELSFYTDGSCLHPTLPTCRYSGFAIVIDLAATDAQRLEQVSRAMTGHKVHTLAPLVSTRTPGAQNIYIELNFLPSPILLSDSNTRAFILTHKRHWILLLIFCTLQASPHWSTFRNLIWYKDFGLPCRLDVADSTR